MLSPVIELASSALPSAMDKDLRQKLWALIEPILAPENIELVELEFQMESGPWILRAFVDSEGGITLDECERASRQISALLDMEDPIARAYTLEVSSPGINRVLRKPKDFARFAGSPVRIRTRAKLDGRRNFNGILESAEDSSVIVSVDGHRVTIDINDIDKARLDLPASEFFRKS